MEILFRVMGGEKEQGKRSGRVPHQVWGAPLKDRSPATAPTGEEAGLRGKELCLRSHSWLMAEPSLTQIA